MQDPTATPAPSAQTPVHGDKLENAVAGATQGPDAADQAGSPGTPAQDAPTDVVEQLQKAEAEVADLRNAWLRARADTENARKQAAAEVQKAYKYAVEKFAEDMLPVADSLEQALSANASPEQLRAGVELTLKQLQSAFGRAQLTPVEPVGEKFDPHRHQAMQMVDSDQAPNTVVQVFQKGYVLNDRVLRPALVAVAKGSA